MKRANFPGRRLARQAEALERAGKGLGQAERAMYRAAAQLKLDRISDVSARKSKSQRKGDLKRGSMLGGGS